MVGRSQTTQRRYIINLTGTEVADVIWAMNQGQEQVFSYTDPKADWNMEQDEFDHWSDRVAAAVLKLTEALNEPGEVWP